MYNKYVIMSSEHIPLRFINISYTYCKTAAKVLLYIGTQGRPT